MLSIVVLFACTAVILPAQAAYSVGPQDLESIFKTLQQQYKPEHPQKHKRDDSPPSSDQSDYSDEAEFGSLKKHQVLNLLKQSPRKDKSDVKYRNINNERHNDELLARLLTHVAQSSGSKKPVKKVDSLEYTSKIIAPNDRLDDNVRDDNEADDLGDLNNYSKIYIVLNPEAVRNSKNKNKVNDMISKVLSLSSNQREQQGRKKNYKGFALKGDLMRRSYRDINEDSEGDYRPKRGRSEHVGGSGARTAIPYIRHRGDIYEKDH